MVLKGDGVIFLMNICLLMFMWIELNCYLLVFVWVVELI